MTKFLPYQQYDVQAIEQWLNRQSLEGYRLVKMDGVFPKFKKYYDHQIFYRVRYCPTAPVSGYKHFWGKLYIYEAFSKAELPAPNYVRDSAEAARRQQKPWFVLALLVAFLSTARYLTTAAGMVLGVGIATLALEAVWMALIAGSFLRGLAIGKERFTPAEKPPKAWTGKLLTAASVLTILLNCLLVFMAEGLL